MIAQLLRLAGLGDQLKVSDQTPHPDSHLVSIDDARKLCALREPVRGNDQKILIPGYEHTFEGAGSFQQKFIVDGGAPVLPSSLAVRASTPPGRSPRNTADGTC